MAKEIGCVYKGFKLFVLDFWVFSYSNWTSSLSKKCYHFRFSFIVVSSKHHSILRVSWPKWKVQLRIKKSRSTDRQTRKLIFVLQPETNTQFTEKECILDLRIARKEYTVLLNIIMHCFSLAEKVVLCCSVLQFSNNLLSTNFVMEVIWPTFRWTLELILDLIPTTLCSMKQLVKKLPWDMIESTICTKMSRSVMHQELETGERCQKKRQKEKG